MSTISVPKDRSNLWSLVVSVLIHVVVLLPIVKNLVPPDLFQLEEQTVVVPPLEFELVSPPENPTPSNNVSKYLSSVSSKASDNVDTQKESDLPHSTGEIPIVDTPSKSAGADGGGASDLPPLPEEQADLGEAFKRSKLTTQSSPAQQPSLPEENPEFLNDGSTRASFGGISINTTAWDFAPYLLDLKHRIKQNWIPPLAFTALGAIHGYTKINFKIYPDGRMEGLTIIETNGHESLHRSSANAIKGAAPFRKLPDNFPEEYLDVTFGFYYLLPGDAEKFFGKGKE